MAAMEPQEASVSPVQDRSITYFNKVENVFVTNAVDSNPPILQKEKCKIHNEHPLDFLCVVCDDEICYLCKLSEHENHETKSIPLAAEEAGQALLSDCAGYIEDYVQSVKEVLQETKQQMQLLTDAEQTAKDKLNERCTQLLSLIGTDSPATCAQLIQTFDDRLRLTADRKVQKGNKNVPPVQPRAESLAAVCSRQARLTDMIYKIREANLQELETLKTGAHTYLASCERDLEGELTAVCGVTEKVKTAVGEKDHVTILRLKRDDVDTKLNKTSLRTRLHDLSPGYSRTLTHHVDPQLVHQHQIMSEKLFWNDRKDVVEDYIRNFLGKVVTTDSSFEMPAVLVQVRFAFRYSTDPGAFVKSLCPRGDEGEMMVSFVKKIRLLNEKQGLTKTFSARGEEVERNSFDLGSLAWLPTSTASSGGKVCFYPYYYEEDKISRTLHAKYNKHYAITSKDCEYLSFHKLYVSKRGAVTSTQLAQFYLPLADHKGRQSMEITAFDASKSGKTFAVVVAIQQIIYNAHGLMDSMQIDRRVLVFDKGQGDEMTMSRYGPPTSAFAPTDVCFFDQKGTELLLIADMGNNSIHMASRPSLRGSFSFDGYLVENNRHPELLCPSALNTDSKGRLWVACKGGYLFIVEPV